MDEPTPFLANTRYARHLRRRQTATEAQVWALLRGRRLMGYKFRRQHFIGGFVVDFYCAELKLAIELDGDVHNTRDRRRADNNRTEILRELGCRVARLRNEDATPDNLRRLISNLTSPPRNSTI